jgi:hypothetical protein
VVYIYSGVLLYYSAIEDNEIMSFCRKIDDTGDHHVKQEKPNSEGQTLPS